ncbi:MAG: hypothetical protein NT075_21690 [Chloroflexi bacterium]|nr:hypothetical protein [Chloroflexota bacterium]
MRVRLPTVTRTLANLSGLLCFLFGISVAFAPQASLAAPLQRPNATSATTLSGQLPHQYSAHYFELESTERDAMIGLTLAYDPYSEPSLRGFVNFLVLDEDGLREYLHGADLKTLNNVASGSPLQFDPIGNKMSGSFRDSGRGKYTVIVYNNAPLAIQYTLSARGGLLTDASGQTSAPADAATAVPATATEVATPVATPTSSVFTVVSALRVSGSLTRRPDRNYLSMLPSVRDGQVAFRFTYDPQDQALLTGNVNFWVLDDEGLRRAANGEKPADLNLATGFPVPFSPNRNELQASFGASGHGPYTVIVYNNAELPATYALSIEGGSLIDQYGQTNEAKIAAVEVAALAPKATPTPVPAAAVAPTPLATTPVSSTTTSAFGVEKLAGALNTAYQFRYIGLVPDRLDGTIGLTLALDPKDNQTVRENVNFWVLTEDGLRRVIAGARPQDLSMAMGMPVQFGDDLGKLSAVFNASGHGKYTIIIFNNNAVPVSYLLSVHGGLLSDETGQIASLP